MLVLKKLNYHNILQFLKEKWNTYLNETCQPYKSGNAKTQKSQPLQKKRQKKGKKTLKKACLKVFFWLCLSGMT